MAYLGIMGPYAVGKTTLTDTLWEWVAEQSLAIKARVGAVNCDANLERYYTGGGVAEQRHHGKTIWKGGAGGKRKEVLSCIGDDSCVWICETGWADHPKFVAEGYVRYGGGAKMIILTCQPDVLRQFLIARCEKCGKPYREDYWTQKILLYESRDRYLNQAKAHLEPAGVPWKTFEVDHDRKVLDTVLQNIKDAVSTSVLGWYKFGNGAD
jgi:hypothetical protein